MNQERGTECVERGKEGVETEIKMGKEERRYKRKYKRIGERKMKKNVENEGQGDDGRMLGRGTKESSERKQCGVIGHQTGRRRGEGRRSKRKNRKQESGSIG